MLDKRKRWLINVVLIVAIAAFAGFALILPLSRAFQDNNHQATSSSSNGTQSSSLADQARGYELVLEREPENELALRELLRIRIEQEDLEGTIPLLEKLVDLHPDRTEYAVLLAQTKQQAGDREGAAQIYREVLSSNAGDMNALQGLASLMLQENRPEAAIGLLQDTLRSADELNRIQPNSVDVTAVQLLLGRVYVELGRDGEAIAIYDEAAQNDPQDFRPILSKALILQTQGNDAEAQPLFTQAESLAPAQYKDEIKRLAAGDNLSTEAPAAPDAAPESGDELAVPTPVNPESSTESDDSFTE